MQLNVVPEALLSASAQIEAIVARMVAVNMAHGVASAAILPPGSDVPSVKTAAGLQAHGVAHEGMAMFGNEELLRSGLGVSESAGSYAIGEGQGVAAFGAIAVGV